MRLDGQPADCVKIKYNAVEAQNAADGLSKKFRNTMRAYHCADCGYWHLTSKEKR